MYSPFPSIIQALVLSSLVWTKVHVVGIAEIFIENLIFLEDSAALPFENLGIPWNLCCFVKSFIILLITRFSFLQFAINFIQFKLLIWLIYDKKLLTSDIYASFGTLHAINHVCCFPAEHIF